MSIPWESLEAGAILTAVSWFLLHLTLPLHSVLSLWGFTRKLLAIYSSQTTCQILKKQSKKISKLPKGKQGFGIVNKAETQMTIISTTVGKNPLEEME